MQVTSGRVDSAYKVVVYGPEGIGKSTFASKFPKPLFIDTEGSTKRMDVMRTPRPSSWTMLFEQVKAVKADSSLCKTLVIDTADWAEKLCMVELCAKAQKNGIEDFGYGKGYTYLYEDFGKLLNLLEDVVDQGIHVVITAHAKMRKFEQPDELGAYDRWELKLQKTTAPLLKEWADMLLFVNYKTIVINVDGQGSEKGKNKAQGGARVMYTTHHICWDAKNRDDLKNELKFDYQEIAHIIERETRPGTAQPAPIPPQTVETAVVPAEPAPIHAPTPPAASTAEKTVSKEAAPALPKPLQDLMLENSVLESEIQLAVASKGYYPLDTPIGNYDPEFISGVLVGAWPQVYALVKDLRENIPF